jgi:hypothetical protein
MSALRLVVSDYHKGKCYVDKLPASADLEVFEDLPERSLLAAILAQAARDYTGTSTTKILPHQYRETVAWFASRSMRPFGFEWICEELGISAKSIRDGLNGVVNGGRTRDFGHRLKGAKHISRK